MEHLSFKFCEFIMSALLCSISKAIYKRVVIIAVFECDLCISPHEIRAQSLSRPYFVRAYAINSRTQLKTAMETKI